METQTQTQTDSPRGNGSVQKLKPTGTTTITSADPGGAITLSEDVVATIAGMAARGIKGIHKLGRSRLIPWDSMTRGVDAEVGKKQAAFDLDVIVDYGVDIREVTSKLRQRIAREVDKMACREVVEVNINVVGLHMPEEEHDAEEDQPRVI